MLKELTPFLQNIKGGPKTTGLGAILLAYSMYMLYSASSNSDYIVNGGIFALGFMSFFLKDRKDETK